MNKLVVGIIVVIILLLVVMYWSMPDSTVAGPSTTPAASTTTPATGKYCVGGIWCNGKYMTPSQSLVGVTVCGTDKAVYTCALNASGQPNWVRGAACNAAQLQQCQNA